MFKNSLILVVGVLSLLLVTMAISYSRSNAFFAADQGASDFYQRHPEWKGTIDREDSVAPVTAESAFPDYYQRHPELSAPLAITIDTTDYFLRHAQPAERAVTKAVTYNAVLGKSVYADDAANFIARNNCTSSGQFQLCQSIGIALWADADQTITTAYLYITNSDDFTAYRGELPLGLSSNDTMATVEQKLGQPKIDHAPQAGCGPGLPDESGSPDHLHYWAIYKRFGVTVVYNSPFASDKGATIQSILVGQ